MLTRPKKDFTMFRGGSLLAVESLSSAGGHYIRPGQYATTTADKHYLPANPPAYVTAEHDVFYFNLAQEIKDCLTLYSTWKANTEPLLKKRVLKHLVEAEEKTVKLMKQYTDLYFKNKKSVTHPFVFVNKDGMLFYGEYVYEIPSFERPVGRKYDRAKFYLSRSVTIHPLPTTPDSDWLISNDPGQGCLEAAMRSTTTQEHLLSVLIKTSQVKTAQWQTVADYLKVNEILEIMEEKKNLGAVMRWEKLNALSEDIKKGNVP
jgi:hypothetical protein